MEERLKYGKENPAEHSAVIPQQGSSVLETRTVEKSTAEETPAQPETGAGTEPGSSGKNKRQSRPIFLSNVQLVISDNWSGFDIDCCISHYVAWL